MAFADKGEASFIERVEGEAELGSQLDLTFTPDAERKVLRKIDLRLIPCLLLSFALQYVDKIILNGAAQFGVIKDLHLYELKTNPVTGQPTKDLHRYSNATLIFYWGYLAGGEFISLFLFWQHLTASSLSCCSAGPARPSWKAHPWLHRMLGCCRYAHCTCKGISSISYPEVSTVDLAMIKHLLTRVDFFSESLRVWLHPLLPSSRPCGGRNQNSHSACVYGIPLPVLEVS